MLAGIFSFQDEQKTGDRTAQGNNYYNKAYSLFESKHEVMRSPDYLKFKLTCTDSIFFDISNQWISR
jgi:hypothetical protein